MPLDDYISGLVRPDGGTPWRRGDKQTVGRANNFPYDRQVSYAYAPAWDGQITPSDTRHSPWDDETGELGEAFEIGTDDPLDPNVFDVFLDSLGGSDNPSRDCDRYMDAIFDRIGLPGHVLPPGVRMPDRGAQEGPARRVAHYQLDWISSWPLPLSQDQRTAASFRLNLLAKSLANYAEAVRSEKQLTSDLDEIIELLEASGTPYDTIKASETPGSGYGTIPGTAGGWAGQPFDDLERKRRERGDTLQKSQNDESAWDELAVTEMGDDGLDPISLELAAARDDFSGLFQSSLDHVDGMPSDDLFVLLMDLDPDYGAEMFAPEDDVEMHAAYVQWGESLSNEED